MHCSRCQDLSIRLEGAYVLIVAPVARFVARQSKHYRILGSPYAIAYSTSSGEHTALYI